MLSLIAAPLSSGLSIVFNNANWLTSHAVLYLVNLFALLPGGHVYLPRFTERPAPIMITVLDEGTGGGAYRSAHNHDWVIDCGGQRKYAQTLKKVPHPYGSYR